MVTSDTLRAQPGANGLPTVLNYQQVEKMRYFDAAGFPGRTIGLSERTHAGP